MNRYMMTLLNSIGLGVVVLGLLSCTAKGDDPGYEYAPNMYHSVPYEPLSQITDKSYGQFVSSIDDGQGEYYNSNPINGTGMNVRRSVPHAVKRNKLGLTPYTVPKDSIEWANDHVKNPLLKYESMVGDNKADGKALYGRFCSHCHGAKGDGKGLVGKRFLGVPNYKVSPYKDFKEGHIFHVITYGKGRMKSHASQLSQEERWKIVLHVQSLQGK